MADLSLEQERLIKLQKLAPAQQRQGFACVRALTVAPDGVTVQSLLGCAGAIAPADLTLSA